MNLPLLFEWNKYLYCYKPEIENLSYAYGCRDSNPTLMFKWEQGGGTISV
jgi:hypothetical protein